jgi:hypothetical protein
MNEYDLSKENQLLTIQKRISEKAAATAKQRMAPTKSSRPLIFPKRMDITFIIQTDSVIVNISLSELIA